GPGTVDESVSPMHYFSQSVPALQKGADPASIIASNTFGTAMLGAPVSLMAIASGVNLGVSIANGDNEGIAASALGLMLARTLSPDMGMSTPVLTPGDLPPGDDPEMDDELSHSERFARLMQKDFVPRSSEGPSDFERLLQRDFVPQQPDVPTPRISVDYGHTGEMIDGTFSVRPINDPNIAYISEGDPYAPKPFDTFVSEGEANNSSLILRPPTSEPQAMDLGLPRVIREADFGVRDDGTLDILGARMQKIVLGLRNYSDLAVGVPRIAFAAKLYESPKMTAEMMMDEHVSSLIREHTVLQQAGDMGFDALNTFALAEVHTPYRYAPGLLMQRIYGAVSSSDVWAALAEAKLGRQNLNPGQTPFPKEFPLTEESIPALERMKNLLITHDIHFSDFQLLIAPRGRIYLNDPGVMGKGVNESNIVVLDNLIEAANRFGNGGGGGGGQPTISSDVYAPYDVGLTTASGAPIDEIGGMSSFAGPRDPFTAFIDDGSGDKPETGLTIRTPEPELVPAQKPSLISRALSLFSRKTSGPAYPPYGPAHFLMVLPENPNDVFSLSQQSAFAGYKMEVAPNERFIYPKEHVPYTLARPDSDPLIRFMQQRAINVRNIEYSPDRYYPMEEGGLALEDATLDDVARYQNRYFIELHASEGDAHRIATSRAFDVGRSADLRGTIDVNAARIAENITTLHSPERWVYVVRNRGAFDYNPYDIPSMVRQSPTDLDLYRPENGPQRRIANAVALSDIKAAYRIGRGDVLGNTLITPGTMIPGSYVTNPYYSAKGFEGLAEAVMKTLGNPDPNR
ncbi:MAG TPA: hypothetical protein VFW00_12695, partial [Rhodocyclaceae bacterium]|nr:hypothetical protein [Rhodocyclaceae bacterium]